MYNHVHSHHNGWAEESHISDTRNSEWLGLGGRDRATLNAQSH